jgi:hypothetical protein
MRTFDQDSVEATQSALKSGKPKAGHAIKKCERAIIPFNAKGRQQERMTTQPA